MPIVCRDSPGVHDIVVPAAWHALPASVATVGGGHEGCPGQIPVLLWRPSPAGVLRWRAAARPQARSGRRRCPRAAPGSGSPACRAHRSGWWRQNRLRRWLPQNRRASRPQEPAQEPSPHRASNSPPWRCNGCRRQSGSHAPADCSRSIPSPAPGARWNAPGWQALRRHAGCRAGRAAGAAAAAG